MGRTFNSLVGSSKIFNFTFSYSFLPENWPHIHSLNYFQGENCFLLFLLYLDGYRIWVLRIIVSKHNIFQKYVIWNFQFDLIFWNSIGAFFMWHQKVILLCYGKAYFIKGEQTLLVIWVGGERDFSRRKLASNLRSFLEGKLF